MNTFIQQGCIKLIKNDSKDMYNVTKDLLFFGLSIHQGLLNIDNNNSFCFLSSESSFSDFWRIMWHWRLEWRTNIRLLTVVSRSWFLLVSRGIEGSGDWSVRESESGWEVVHDGPSPWRWWGWWHHSRWMMTPDLWRAEVSAGVMRTCDRKTWVCV